MQKDSSNTICGTVFHFSFQLFDKTHVFTVSRSGKRSNMFSIISVGRLLILSEVEALLRVIFFGGDMMMMMMMISIPENQYQQR